MKALELLLSEIEETLSAISESGEKAKYKNVKQNFESRLLKLLVNELTRDFHIERETMGHFILTDDPVRIDCCMFPKPHLVEKGFVQQWTGVEVKVPEPKKGFAGKGGQVLWQSIIYSQSRFNVPKNPEDAGLRTSQRVEVRPAFVLVFPRLLKFFEEFLLGRAFEAFGQQANVGSLEFTEDGWIIVGHATAYYFSRSNDVVKAHDLNCLVKRHVGTKK
jgi:hypothetical protein